MKIEIDAIGETPVAHLSGEIDMSNVSVIEDKINASVTNKAFALILDLSRVTYLDSSGIRLLYQMENRVQSRQQRLIVVVPREAEINRTLEASGAIGSLQLVRSIDDAFSALGR